MKKFRFLLVVAIVLVSALALCLTAGATETITAETYDQVYVGEYTSDETPVKDGVSYSGEAYIIFGKVEGAQQAGVVVERYDVTDSACANVLETKLYDAREGRIADNGEFGIALFNVADGYYKAKVVAGTYDNIVAEGDYVTFSKGVATYTVDFVVDGDTKVTYQVAAGGTVVPPVAEREGFELAGWRYSVLDANLAELDQNHRSADWGFLPETDPAYFVINSNRAYVARWKWVGVEDCAAPETMKVNITGYSKLSAKFDESASIATGEVAVMSFDVLETASASGWTSIGLTTINNTFWNLAVNGYSGDQIFLPYDNNGSIGEYNNMSNVTSSTDVYMYPSNVLKKGKSLLFVYKPHESDTNPGYYRAYWKNTGSDDDYVLVAGWENLNSAQAIVGNMPCLATNGGELTVALKNFNISIDADGDYTTTDDWTNMGMGVAENCNDLRSASNSTGYNDKRYVNINTNYVAAIDYTYAFTDGTKTANANTVLAGASTVNRNDYNVDEGEYLEMKFTVTDSNVDVIEETLFQGRISLGLGLSHNGSANNGFSGIHGYGLQIGLEDGDDAVVLAEAGPAGNSQYSECDTIETVSYNVGMRTLLKPGTEIIVVIALDLTADGSNTGYMQVYYKTTEMADYDIAAEMTGVGNTVAMSDTIANAYPLVWMTSNYVDNDATKLTIAFSNYYVATYDADGNVTSEVVLANPSVGGNGGTTVITNPAN